MDYIWLSSPHMSDEGYEQKFINEAFETNWIAPLGNNVNMFEKELCEFVGAENAVALSSGTAAIHLALKAAGVKPGDHVICQSLTFSATANPIIYEGAIPVFVDSDYSTWNMDPELLKKAIKEYPEAKVAIVVNLYGLTSNLEEISQICTENGIILIEDAAESLGSKYNEKFTGTFGDYGIFSFNGNKIITTSGGGMLVSKNKEMIEKCRFWASQSRDKALHYQHSELGYNYRLSNICAGIGRGQLRVLKDRIEKKRAIYNLYVEKLSHLKGIKFMPVSEYLYSNHWLSTILVPEYIDSKEIMAELFKHNIESRPIWKPMHLQPFFSRFPFIGNNVSEELFKYGICLPSDTKMNEDLQNFVIDLIINIWKDFL